MAGGQWQEQSSIGLYQWKMPARVDWHFSFILRSVLPEFLNFVGPHVNVGADYPWRTCDIKGHGA
jgi:hypothetical protein